MDVRMISAGDAPATITSAAGVIFFFQAIERLRQGPCNVFRAGAARTGKQVCVRQPTAFKAVPELLGNGPVVF